MYFLSRIRELCIDFLFPKNPKTVEIETLSTQKILDSLPKAELIPNKYTTAIFDYNHPLVKEIVWELKYNGNKKIADKLGEILYIVIKDKIKNNTFWKKQTEFALIPIPISDKRRFKRGWNQSELLAESLIKYDKEKSFKYLPRQLAKLRHTESQTKISSKKERLGNLSNSMKVLNPLSISEKYVIVLDDVTTTGSTFSEARRALYEAGAKKIFCVAVAH